jgi:hypothetical protein
MAKQIGESLQLFFLFPTSQKPFLANVGAATPDGTHYGYLFL